MGLSAVAAVRPLLLDGDSDAMTAALKKVNESAEFREFMANRGFGVKWADGAGFANFMDEGNKAMGVAMKAAGLAKG